MKLNQMAFANAIASLSVLSYAVFYAISLVAPEFFRILFNSQFLGADVASLIPQTQALGTALVNLVVMGVFGWIVGYIWAGLYNYWAK